VTEVKSEFSQINFRFNGDLFFEDSKTIETWNIIVSTDSSCFSAVPLFDITISTAFPWFMISRT
jgi:hypothetical protein